MFDAIAIYGFLNHNYLLGACRGRLAGIAIVVDTKLCLTRSLFKACSVRTYSLFVLYVCLSTNISVILYLQGFSCSSDDLTFLCSDLSSGPMRVLLYCV